jgi:ATP-binding cassette subfamily B protein
VQQQQRKIKPGTLRRTLVFAAPHSDWLVLFMAVVIASAAIGIANPLIYRAIIDDGILPGNASLVIRLAILIGGLGVLDAAFGLAQTYLAARIGAAVVVSLRTRLYEHIQQMPLAFFSRTQTGALVNRLLTDATGVRTAFTDFLSNVVGNAVAVLLILLAMLILSWQITVAALILIPLFVLPARHWGQRIQTATREAYDLGAQMSSVMVERFNIAGALLTKLFGGAAQDARAFDERARELAKVGIKAALYGRMFATQLILIASFASALAYGWGGVLVAHHELKLGTLVALTSLLFRLYGPLAGLANVQLNVMTALVSFERVFEILDLVPILREKPDPVPIPAGPLRVRFEHVSFRYPSAADVSLASLESIAIPEKKAPETVLHDIDFEVEPGQLVALVGLSGAGKTTITQLISRLYDVQAGAVRLNGVDVRDATLESLRGRIGVVTQEAHLFHESIRANLSYAKPQASEEQIWAALEGAQILSLVKSLPEGLDTIVGDRGYRFSGGEKQRFAIARLLLKSPDLVILDEATAHLDSCSEATVQQTLEQALRGRTAIVIAHRLSTVLEADQVLVVDNGRIVQRGTHDQLASVPGLYSQLYRRQLLTQSASRKDLTFAGRQAEV